MMRRLLLATLLAGCGTTSSATIDDRVTARLPEGERRNIVAAQQNIDVAHANLAAAKVSKDEAEKFERIAARELEADRARLQAARDALGFERPPRGAYVAQARFDVATRELLASKAKHDYAERMVELCAAHIEEQEATLAAIKADLELAKYEALDRNGMADDLERSVFERARSRAQEKLAERRMRTASLQGVVAALRTNWDQRRRESNLAASETGALPIRAARPPGLLVPDWVHPAPRRDVNQGPSAPENAPVDKLYQYEP